MSPKPSGENNSPVLLTDAGHASSGESEKNCKKGIGEKIQPRNSIEFRKIAINVSFLFNTECSSQKSAEVRQKSPVVDEWTLGVCVCLSACVCVCVYVCLRNILHTYIIHLLIFNKFISTPKFSELVMPEKAYNSVAESLTSSSSASSWGETWLSVELFV